jgi:hypothetical protein
MPDTRLSEGTSASNPGAVPKGQLETICPVTRASSDNTAVVPAISVKRDFGRCGGPQPLAGKQAARVQLRNRRQARAAQVPEPSGTHRPLEGRECPVTCRWNGRPGCRSSLTSRPRRSTSAAQQRLAGRHAVSPEAPVSETIYAAASPAAVLKEGTDRLEADKQSPADGEENMANELDSASRSGYPV